jgi:hypothetical protein
MGIKISEYFPSRFLSGDEIKNRIVPVVISKVVEEMVPEKKGSTKEEPTLVVYFEGKDRGVSLNKTRAKEIRKITGEDDVATWPGKQVALYTQPEKAFGEIWNVIHFKSPGAAPAPAIPPEDSNEEMSDEEIQEAADNIPV